MPPNSRRPLGPGGAARPPSGAGGAGAGREPNTGASPYRNRYEQAMFGAFAPTPPTVRSSPPTAREEIEEAIGRAETKLGPQKAEALRRAFGGDDSLLLDVRPTNTSNPFRPRTVAAGYDPKSQTLFVRFRGPKTGPGQYADGVGYEYYRVRRSEWRSFRDNWSPGRYINSVLNGKAYTPASW